MSYNKNTAIDWPGLTHTFNPVIGCKRGCDFCYARDLHDKRYEAYKRGKLQNCKQYAKPFNKIQFFPERLTKPPKAAKRVFVGDMTDIDYWPHETTEKIIDYISQYPHVEYMFLSKNCISYRGFNWPENAILGLTLTCTQIERCQFESAMQMVRYGRAFLSIEPLLGTLKIQKPMHLFEYIIVGRLNHRNAPPPKREWVQSIIENVPPKILHWKNPGEWNKL